VQQVGPAGAAACIAITKLPWTVKPIYGFMSDNYPIGGQRRKPYILLAMLVVSVSWFYMTVFVVDEFGVVFIMVISNIAAATANVAVEALTVEYSRDQTYDMKATLQSCVWGSCAAASFVGAAFGGFLLENGIEKRQMFALCGCIPVFCMVSAGLSHEDEVAPETLALTESPRVFLAKVWAFLTSVTPAGDEPQGDLKEGEEEGVEGAPKSISVPNVCIFLLIFFSVPDTSATSYFYLTNELHMGERVLAVITTVAMATYVVGVCMYELTLKDMEIRRFLMTATVLGAGLTMSTVLLYTGVNRILGLPDETFVITDSALIVAVKTVAQLPLMTLLASLCPKSLEGTLFSVFTSIANLGGVLGGWLGACLTLTFGITSHSFNNMWALCLACSLLQLAPLFFLHLLPGKAVFAAFKEQAARASGAAPATAKENSDRF